MKFAKPRIVAKKMQLFEGSRVLLAWGCVRLVSLWKTCLGGSICIELLASKWTTQLRQSRASRFLTLRVLWTGRGCPESGRFSVVTSVVLVVSRINSFDDDH